jgi:hypothetical protein
MGYYSQCRGEITFNPPLTWAEIKDSKFLNPTLFYDIEIEVEEQSRDTEDGVVLSRVGRKLVTPEDDHKFYDIKDRFEEFAEEFDLGNGRASGYIVRVGEESGDVERYSFDQEGLLKSESAHLVWADGSLVDKADCEQ